MTRKIVGAAAVAIAALLILQVIEDKGIRAADGPNPIRRELLAAPVTEKLGGDTTRVVSTDKAFTFLASNAPKERQRAFFFGNRLFNTNWAEFPASVKIFDGLGPTFNRNSCSGCHVRDGRGRPPGTIRDSMESMLIRIGKGAGTAVSKPHPDYGDQLNDRAVLGVPAEGRAVITYDDVPGVYGDGTPYTLLKPEIAFVDLAHGDLDDALISPRVAPHVIGMGLLESVPLVTLEALADPDDADGDGISGRVNWLTDHAGKPAPGRFGWKANVASLREQTAGAAIGDIGLTTSLFPKQNCPPAQAECAATAQEEGPEINDAFLDRLVAYVSTIAVPMQRTPDDPEVTLGAQKFRDFGCAACHVPTLRTDGAARFSELRDQTFHAFTDLLVHDMGEGLADGRPDGEASGSEWRTPPLWGLGLVETVNGHDRLLHDGRARGFAEAILWHGGEAEAAKEAFRNAPAAERDALVRFLGSL
jgi:CxxC motif-containing protein (DUF1111 family)